MPITNLVTEFDAQAIRIWEIQIAPKLARCNPRIQKKPL
jgi:hypothetical protein